MDNTSKVKWSTFLKDVLICSLGAYGGPEAHYGVFTDQMVTKKKYLNEDELVELIALTGILPGPSSTQTITSIGYKVGGPLLAFLTLLVWAMPAIVVMTLLSFMYFFLSRNQVDTDVLRYIGPMAVGFIAVAAYRIGRKVVKNKITLFLFILGMVVTYFWTMAFIYPLILLTGGVTYLLVSNEKSLWHKVTIRPPWKYFIAFVSFAVIGILLSTLFDNRLFFLFERFYRFGYLVIGGGQVVVPYMVTDLVDVHQFMTLQEFLTGFGIVQGIPGPMFSFSAYAGGMSSRDLGSFEQVLGALISGIAIFLPGTLLIFFVYPIWASLRTMKGIKVALIGISAVAGGLIAIAAFKLMQDSGFYFDNILVLILTIIILLTKKVPAPFIVLASIILGFLI
jgi:chromate transporter